MRQDETGPFDGELVAYLDEALPAAERAMLQARLAAEPELRARLEFLSAGGRPFRASYDALLAAAPADRLATSLDSMLAVTAPRPILGTLRGAADWRRFAPAAIAAGLALFAAGYTAGHGLPAWLPFGQTATDRDGPEAWREVVADYLTLTTSQTLTAMRPPEAQLQADLAIALKKVGLGVPPASLALPGRKLMKVELYHYDNTPLAQITYLDEQNGPVSLCITARADKPEASALERRGDMNVAYWSSPTHAFMLVGLAPQEILGGLAVDVAGRLGG